MHTKLLFGLSAALSEGSERSARKRDNLPVYA
jgi:hypothetical protein